MGLTLLQMPARGGHRTAEMIARLDRLEEEANHATVSVRYASMLYSLRDHIDLVREGIKKDADKGGGTGVSLTQMPEPGSST